MTSFSDLVTYFETLARQHKSIGHSDQEKHFFRFEIEEVLAGINRTDSEYPMLVLEGYNFDYTDNKSDNILKNRNMAFDLLDVVKDITDYSEIHDVWNRMEAIGDDILARVKADKRNPQTPVVSDFSFASVQAIPIINETGNNAGIRYTFSLVSPAPADVDPEKWSDIDGSN
mgnify:CR=1 FL=1